VTSSSRDKADEALIVVSGDAHTGPRLVEDLRPYCPSAHLEQFDDWVHANEETAAREHMFSEDSPFEGEMGTEASTLTTERMVLNRRTEGHFDPNARLRDMDYDGVSAEVLFHGSQNDQCFPFVGMRDYFIPYTDLDLDLALVGSRIYNRWLADFVSVAPERFVANAYLPMWDPALAVRELELAATAGLNGVNFPAPKAGMKEYDDPVWEPFWSACEFHGVTLASHAGVPYYPVSGPQRLATMMFEVAGWPARRGMPRMIFGGVFERHPNLRLVLTEQTRGWWNHEMKTLDFAYGVPSEALRKQVPKLPSEYMKTNVFIGASYMPPAEVEEALLEGYADQIIWGSDYPHGEGTYKYPERENEPSMTRQHQRWAFANCPPEVTRAMLGETAIRVYNLDRAALAEVAARIGPRLADVGTPLTEFPPGWHDDLHGFGVRVGTR